MHPKSYPGHFWPSSCDPVPCFVSFNGDGSLQVAGENIDGLGLIFITQNENRRYGLGEWEVSSERAVRPRKFNINSEVDLLSLTKLEKSALHRLCDLLQRHESLSLELRIGQKLVHATSVPLSMPISSSLFYCKTEVREASHTNDVMVTVHIQGMTYSFRSHFIDSEGTTLALTLPSTADRYLRRITPRVSTKLRAYIEEPINASGVIQNISLLGLAIDLSDSVQLELGEEIRLTIPEIAGTLINTYALVIGIQNSCIHLIFAAGEENTKERYYALLSQMYDPYQFKEDPDQAWNCLDRFKYLDLLEGRILETIKHDCLRAWNALKEDCRNFHPVAFQNREAVGTIAAIEASENHWIPHSLATKVDPGLIDITAALYMSWPNYLLSLSKPIWVSTWYDANKPWHNRFYQVFIEEHKKDVEMVTFVRQYFFSKQLELYPEAEEAIEIVEIRDSQNVALEHWNKRYGSGTRAPVLSPFEHESTFFKYKMYSLFFKKTFIGVAKIVIGTILDPNPFSLLNVSHVNLFSEEYRLDVSVVRIVAQACSSFMLRLGVKRGAITLDYDTPKDVLNGTCFVHFVESRCLATNVRHFPSLISNNCLSFADMLNRKKAV